MRSFHIDQSRFDAQKNALASRLTRRADKLKSEMTEPIREVGAQAAEMLAAVTFPGPAAIGLAIAAMRFDFGRVYATAGKIYEILDSSAGKAVAGAFYAAWKRGNIDAARLIIRKSQSPISDIIIGRALDPSIREKARDKNGRVMSAHPKQLVTDDDFAAGLKTAIAEIGKTASGWFACAEKLGGDGNAIRWKGTTVHGSDGGSVEIQVHDAGVRLVMTNHRSLAKKHISPGQVERVREWTRETLRERFAEAVRQVA